MLTVNFSCRWWETLLLVRSKQNLTFGSLSSKRRCFERKVRFAKAGPSSRWFRSTSLPNQFQTSVWWSLTIDKAERRDSVPTLRLFLKSSKQIHYILIILVIPRNYKKLLRLLNILFVVEIIFRCYDFEVRTLRSQTLQKTLRSQWHWGPRPYM